jgi:hypothetical protein
MIQVRRAVTRLERARPRWWTQVAIVAFLLWAYDEINNFNPFRRATAIGHGVSLMHLELRIHLDPELALNRWLSLHASLGRFLADYYDLAHFAVTLPLLAWVWWRCAPRYRMLRNSLIGIHVVGFAIFWFFPVAPPRMLSSFGFVDVVAVTHAVGAWSTGALASQANEYAAMPSLHVAWALWCAVAVWSTRRDAVSRVVSAAYAITTCVVVMATANHYFLDVAAGFATTALAVGAARWWERRAGGSRGRDGGERRFDVSRPETEPAAPTAVRGRPGGDEAALARFSGSPAWIEPRAQRAVTLRWVRGARMG